MGISTREYARPYIGGSLPSAIKMLLIANVAIYLLQVFGPGQFLLDYFALRPASLFSMFAVWQLATYMFLHGSPTHILFNMLALWMFGSDLEGVWGPRRFLQFYFFCGIGAALCITLLAYLMPGHEERVTTIGASGAIFGILIASAMLWPNRTVLLIIFPIQMKYLVIIYGAISFIGAYEGSGGGGISHIGHLGGLLFGWLYMKYGFKRRPAIAGRVPSLSLGERYKSWKLERNKRRFQVYLKKHGPDRDTWTN